MATEKTWVTDANWVAYTGGSYLNCGQNLLLKLKNKIVASGGWTVVGSSDGVSNYEYEGVTGGGSYGGDSTGPYDVWADIGDVRRAADGSSPGWCLLKGPTSDGWTMYLVIAMEGTSDSTDNGYLALADKNWLLHPDGAILYLPVADPDAKTVSITRRKFFGMYSGTYTTRAYLSMCPADGSFFLSHNLTIRTYWTGFIHVAKLDPTTVPSGWPPWFIGIHGDGIAIYDSAAYWKVFTSDEWCDPSLIEVAMWAKPYRYNNVDIMNTDLSTVDCNGEAALFPFFVCVPREISNLEYNSAAYGRVQDGWIAPRGLTDEDTVPSASPEYYKCVYWMLPGDTTPQVGP